MTDQRATLLVFYKDYTATFQSAYQRFAADPDAEPDASTALDFYHAPCLFMSPFGIELYARREDLGHYFAEVMRDMQAKRYLRTELGSPQISCLGSSSALVSLEIARFNVDGQQYDQYGCSYTLQRVEKQWRIVVVTTHGVADVLRESAAQ